MAKHDIPYVNLPAQGRDQLDEFWRTWSFLSERLTRLHEGEI